MLRKNTLQKMLSNSVCDISLGRFTEKNAVEMLELFLECMPEYNIDRPDGDGKP